VFFYIFLGGGGGGGVVGGGGGAPPDPDRYADLGKRTGGHHQHYKYKQQRTNNTHCVFLLLTIHGLPGAALLLRVAWIGRQFSSLKYQVQNSEDLEF
jgi:hypothetical protein